MFIANKDIKDYAKAKGVRLWQIAMEMGIADVTFSKKMRVEQTEESKAEIKAIIDRIANKNSEVV